MPGLIDILSLLGGGGSAGQVSGVTTPDQGGGLFSGLSQWAGDHSNQLTGLGAGLLSGDNWASGLSSGFQQAGIGKRVDRKDAKDRKAENATQAWLATQQNLSAADRAYLEANPDAAAALYAQTTAPKAPIKLGEGDQLLDPKDYHVLAQGQQQPTAAKAPTTREFYDPKSGQNVVQQWGEQGWQTVGMAPQTKRDAAQPPAGFRWSGEPGQSDLVAIPGGPATQIPAEVAGRIGLAKDFITRAPALRKRIEGGELDGLTGAAGLATGVGKPGEIGLEFEAGKEALVRQLTGAGKSESEAKDYASQYSPLPTDSKERILYKLDALTRRLQASAAEVGVGHGGSRINSPGVQSTATGVQWSVEP